MISLRERAGALSERPFRLLWLGQTTSAIGDVMVGVALAFAVFQIGGGAAQLGLVLASLTIGRTAFVLVGGVWADRLPRRLVMLTCDAIRAVVQAFVAVALLTGAAEIWMLAVTSFVFGAASAFFLPAATGLVPQTISAGRLQQANALLALSRSSVQVVGPAVSGVIVAAAEPGWVFAIDALTFVASAAFLSVLPIAATERPQRRPFLHELAEGARAAWSRGWMRAGLSLTAVTVLGIATFLVLRPVISKRDLDGATSWGIILARRGDRRDPGRRRRVAPAAEPPARRSVRGLVVVGVAGARAAAAVADRGHRGRLRRVPGGHRLRQQPVRHRPSARDPEPPALSGRLVRLARGARAEPGGPGTPGPASEAFGTDAVLVTAAVLVVLSCAVGIAAPSVRAITRAAPASARDSGSTDGSSFPAPPAPLP